MPAASLARRTKIGKDMHTPSPRFAADLFISMAPLEATSTNG
jgi:hypothetical protein